MSLVVSQVLPDYFDAVRKEHSEVWGKNLEVEKGDYVKIVAPSGSGKTSLIHFLYGMRHQYEGEILYDGQNMRTLKPETLATLRKDKVSVVLQDMRLFNSQTVLENLEIKRQLQPYHPPEMIPLMLDRLGIDTKAGSLCGTCSYGEQQRVAIIRALLQPFDYLLLDEPFSHLDNRNSEMAMELILEEASKRDSAILFADLERIEFFPYTRILHL